MEVVHLGPEIRVSLSMPEQPRRHQRRAHHQKAEAEVAGGNTQVDAHHSAELVEEKNEREAEADQCQRCPDHPHQGLVECYQRAFERERGLAGGKFKRGRIGGSLMLVEASH